MIPSKIDKYSAVQTTILSWYNQNKRDLPWRNANNPYLTWVSEIILQQTRVDQGKEYYLRFIQKFPDVFLLARSNEDELLKVWQGLGYYSRARNMHKAAKIIVGRFEGLIPRTYEDLIQLPGVGEYTASAILSIAFDKPFPVLDGNVFRVLARIWGVKLPVDSVMGRKRFKSIAVKLLPRNNPGNFNEAIMDFGAIQCTPASPDCYSCCVNEFCEAYLHKAVNDLPLKLAKKPSKKRFFYYFIICYQGQYYINKRQANDIWKNLYEFPLLEFNKRTESNEVFIRGKEAFTKSTGNSFELEEISEETKHVLSHQIIYARFIKVTVGLPLVNKSLLMVSANKLSQFAVPRLIDRFIEQHVLSGQEVG